LPILKEIPVEVTGHVPVKIWTDRIEESAERQLTALARLPFVVRHIAAMPDVHYAPGATVGSVFATRDVLLPTAVGSDIGCGMLAQPFDVRAAELPASFLRELHEGVKRHIPTGLAHHRAPQAWEGLEDDRRYTRAVASQVRERGAWHLGSLGGGNHFIELCQDDAGMAWLLLHSGSRGPGGAVAKHHVARALALREKLAISTTRELPALPLDTQEGRDYLTDLSWAQDYAAENRERMARAFIELFAELLRKRLRLDLAFDPAERINIHHNYAAREEIDGEAAWVHRKGATRAGAGELGIIPGSMATGSYIVRGLGNPESFNSCSHGAGRVMSRGDALRSISVEAFAHKMRGIVAEVGREFLDEAPQAYKDLDTVLHHQSDLVEPVRRLRTIMNIKGAGKADLKRFLAADDAAPRKRVIVDRTRDKADPVQARKLAQRRARRG
jgi:tRNA-splicing ligase RtcB